MVQYSKVVHPPKSMKLLRVLGQGRPKPYAQSLIPGYKSVTVTVCRFANESIRIDVVHSERRWKSILNYWRALSPHLRAKYTFHTISDEHKVLLLPYTRKGLF